MNAFDLPTHFPRYHAETFLKASCLDKLEAFVSHHGADFYGLPRNSDLVVIEYREVAVPETLPLGDDVVVPIRAGQTVLFAGPFPLEAIAED